MTNILKTMVDEEGLCRVPLLPWDKNGTKDNTEVLPLLHHPLVISEEVSGKVLKMDSEGLHVYGTLTSHESIIAQATHEMCRKRIPKDMVVYAVLAVNAKYMIYRNLPHYVLIHTIYNQNTHYIASTEALMSIAAYLELPAIPILLEHKFKSISELQEVTENLLFSRSTYCPGFVKGLVLRKADRYQLVGHKILSKRLENYYIKGIKVGGTNNINYHSKYL